MVERKAFYALASKYLGMPEEFQVPCFKLIQGVKGRLIG